MSSPQASTGLLPAGHIGLNVSNLNRASDFYSRVFGLELLNKSEAEDRKFAFLGSKEQIVLTLWQQSAGRANHKQPGLHHLSFQAASVEQVQRAEAQLKSLGVKFYYHGIVPHVEGADSGGIFFEDPDGIRLEIFAPAGVKELNAKATHGPACGFF
jgi:lactoylglutathione lyase